MPISSGPSSPGYVSLVGESQSVATLAWWTVQPPAGQEWQVTEAGSSGWIGSPPNSCPHMIVKLGAGYLRYGDAAYGYPRFWPLEALITNSLALGLYNGSSSSRNLVYCGYRLK